MSDLLQNDLCVYLNVNCACRAQAVAEDRDALNGVQQLSQEATIVNQNFSQQARRSLLCLTSSAAGAAAIVLSTIDLPEVMKIDTCAALDQSRVLVAAQFAQPKLQVHGASVVCVWFSCGA